LVNNLLWSICGALSESFLLSKVTVAGAGTLSKVTVAGAGTPKRLLELGSFGK